MRKSQLSALLFCLISLPAFAQKNKYEKLLAPLDAIIAAQMKEWHVEGLAIGVVYKNQLVYAKGFGFRNRVKNLPVTAETFFRIGSNTKAFVATTLGVLGYKHKRNYLDTPIHEIFPQLQFSDEFTNSRATPKDLLSHRTGLPRGDWFGYMETASADSFFLRIRNTPQQSAFRTEHIYNNYMYVAIGKLIENISKASWEQNLRSELLDPLQMTNTGATTTEWLRNENRSMGYTVVKDSAVTAIRDSAVFGPVAAGSMHSNIPELAKWLSAWIYGGKINNHQIIPEAYYRQALSSLSNIHPGFNTAVPELQLDSYGLGFHLANYRGHYLAFHGGRVAGFTSNISFMPKDSIGVIVLINQNNSPLYYNLMYTVYDHLLQQTPVDWNGRERKNRLQAAADNRRLLAQDSIDRVKDTKPSHQLSDYNGRYYHAGIGYLAISEQSGKLSYRLNQLPANRLEHYHYDVFISPLADARKLAFSANNQGVIDRVKFLNRATNEVYEFTRL